MKSLKLFFSIYAVAIFIVLIITGIYFDRYFTKLTPSTEEIDLSYPFSKFFISIRPQSDSMGPATFVFRNDLSRQGVIFDGDLNFPMEQVWQTKSFNIGVHSASKSSPAVDQTGIYLGSDAGWFFRYSADGKMQWRFRISGTTQGIHGTAALDDQFVYFSGYNGILYKAKKLTGEIVWLRKMADAIGSSVLLSSEFMYVSCETNERNGYIAKLRRDSGEIVWKSRWLLEQIHSSPTLSTDRSIVYVGTNAGNLHAFNAVSGEELWAYNAKGPIKGTAIAYDNKVAFTSWGDTITALDQHSGKLIWNNNLNIRSQSSPSYVSDTLIFSAYDKIKNVGNIFAVNAKTGITKWKIPSTGTLIGSTLSIYSKKAKTWISWTGCRNSKLCGIQSTNGKILQEIELGGGLTGSPTYFQNKLYVNVFLGGLMQFTERSALPNK